MPRPSATTWLLVLLVLVPSGVLAALGFQAADAYDAADATRLRTELDTGLGPIEAAATEDAATVARRLRAAVVAQAAYIAAHPGDEAMAGTAARLEAQGIRVTSVRLVDAQGVGLWPAEFVPPETLATAELAPTGASLLEYLRRTADRAFYGDGGYEAAAAIWREAQSRFRVPTLRRLADVEAARLRVRAGRETPTDALAALHEAWEGAPPDGTRLGRPYLLLRMAAAEAKGDAHAALIEDVRAGRTARIPLTTEERARLHRMTRRAAGARAQGMRDDVELEAPVAHGARLRVRLDPERVRKLFRETFEARSVAPLYAIPSLVPPEEALDDLPVGTRSVTVPVLMGLDVLLVVGHGEADAVRGQQRQRRWWLSGGVFLLFAVTLLGLFLTRRAVAQERAARRMRDEFIANVTHEVRTPLTSVLLHSEILADEDTERVDETKRREHAQVVRAQGKRLAQLVDDMLDFSALERGTRTLESVPVDLGAACREAAAPYGILAEREGTDLACEVDGDEVPAMADPAALARVLANLLGNAWKHGRPSRDGHAGRIRIAAHDVDGRPVVDVADDGPGIPKEERDQIFARFGRGRGAKKKEGAGIGLALSRDLAQAMGGDLVVFEAEGETIFRLQLEALPDWEMDL